MEHRSAGRISPGRQGVGWIAAVTAGLTFVFGFAMFATALANRTALHVWHLAILFVFGVVLVALVVALHERLRDGAPGLAQTAGAFGIIWATLVIAVGMIANIGLETIGAVFGLGLIFWFTWVGVVMIRTDARSSAPRPDGGRTQPGSGSVEAAQPESVVR